MPNRYHRRLPASATRVSGFIVALTLGACAGLPAGPALQLPATPAAVLAVPLPAPATGGVYYVTDRLPTSGAGYGRGRSASMAFGRVDVVGSAPKGPVDAQELIRFPATPVPFSQVAGRIVPDPEAARDYRLRAEAFKRQVATALRQTQQDTVVLYVHGFRNEFGESVRTTRTLWLASGRVGVPIAFSWPAGNTGVFGYFRDTESGEFSVFHLKETLRLLAEVRGLRAINIIAHSRGTDVATTALREMIIAVRASGRNPRRVLKIENLIMAAPDLDFGIVRQRLLAEGFGPAFARISVYMNPNDETLAMSQSVLSGTRFGRLTADDLGDNERVIFSAIHNVDFIDVENVVRRSGHSYFRLNPAVLADIAALLQRSPPPQDPSRRLVSLGGNFWAVTNPPKRRIPSGERGGEVN